MRRRIFLNCLTFHNYNEIKYQAVTTNPFILTFLQRFECSSTQSTEKCMFIKTKTP